MNVFLPSPYIHASTDNKTDKHFNDLSSSKLLPVKTVPVSVTLVVVIVVVVEQVRLAKNFVVCRVILHFGINISMFLSDEVFGYSIVCVYIFLPKLENEIGVLMDYRSISEHYSKYVRKLGAFSTYYALPTYFKLNILINLMENIIFFVLT